MTCFRKVLFFVTSSSFLNVYYRPLLHSTLIVCARHTVPSSSSHKYTFTRPIKRTTNNKTKIVVNSIELRKLLTTSALRFCDIQSQIRELAQHQHIINIYVIDDTGIRVYTKKKRPARLLTHFRIQKRVGFSTVFNFIIRQRVSIIIHQHRLRVQFH